MKTLSTLLFATGALAFNPVLPLLQHNNTLVSEPTKDIISDPLAKRWTCPSTCSTNICCENGLCVRSLSDVCCGSYFCTLGNHCCGTGCMPSGGDCCGVQGYCPAGERCMSVNGELTCCLNGDCSQGNAVEPQTHTQTQTQNEYTTAHATTYTNVELTWYSWTVTWTYWVTFYSYYAPSTASVRTSTVTTTSTVVSVYATDGSDASSSFTRLSATMSFYTPASATDPPMPTDAVTDSGPTVTSSGNGGGSSSGDSGSSGGSGDVGISVNGVMGGGDSNAANVNYRLGWEAVLSLSIVLGTGLLMVYL